MYRWVRNLGGLMPYSQYSLAEVVMMIVVLQQKAPRILVSCCHSVTLQTVATKPAVISRQRLTSIKNFYQAFHWRPQQHPSLRT